MRRVGRSGVTGHALRHRVGQATALFVLSLLGVAACAFGPLYERAVETAQLKLTLNNTPIFSRGLVVRSSPADGGTDPLQSADSAIERYYGPPIVSDELNLNYYLSGKVITSTIVHRADECQHLHLVSGRCPTGPTDVLASTTSAKSLSLRLGATVPVFVTFGQGQPDRSSGTVRIVGLYAPYDPHDDYWFDHSYGSATGAQESHVSRQEGVYAADAFLAPDGFLVNIAKKTRVSIDNLPVTTELDLPLRVDQVGLDDMPRLRSAITSLIAANSGPDSGGLVSTNLLAAFDQVDTGRHEARSVIPAFAVELGLLVLVVIGIVVVAAADQRRSEFALARLRGRSATRSAALFLRELAAPVLLAAIPGLIVAWLICRLACRWWLSGGAQPELRSLVLLAAGSVVLVELLLVATVAGLTARRPVHDLMRRVPLRVGRRGIGAGEAALAAAAIAGTVVVLSGDRHNAIAVLTPGLIALLVGMVLSHVLALLSRTVGRRALWRGRLGLGLAGLQVARRPGMRRVVILLCVAAALVVSAADQWRVSARNRSVRAGAESGASVALTVRAGNVNAFEKAVAAADPSGRYATPVVIQRPNSGPVLVAAQPTAFARVAAWGWPKDRPSAALLSKLNPARPEPVSLRGTSAQLRLASESLVRYKAQVGTGTPGAVFLVLHLRNAAGAESDVRVGPLPSGTNGSLTLSAAVPCADGCRLTQISLQRPTADIDGIQLDMTIAGLYAGPPGALSKVDLGSDRDWGEATPETAGAARTELISMSSDRDGLTLSAYNSGTAAVLQHLNVPIAVPAITAGSLPDVRDDRGYLFENNIDGVASAFRSVGQTPLIPGTGEAAMLVDLDLAAAVASSSLGDSTAAVWLHADDPERERALVATLGQHGIGVLSRDTAAKHRAVLAATAPAWAMQLALVTALLAVLIAGLVILISAMMSRRARAGDTSALALIGVDRSRLRRATVLEHTVAVVTGVLVGSAVGVLGAHLALPAIPMFLDDVATPAILRTTAWGSAVLAAALTLAVLLLASLATGLALARRVATNKLGEAEQ